ncbi:hypothetical protein [Streptomyces inhibens]|nr:hypothetical protein [Streptomyces inhibens]
MTGPSGDPPRRRAYTTYEQRGGHGTDHRTLTYGLPGGDAEFKPYVR